MKNMWEKDGFILRLAVKEDAEEYFENNFNPLDPEVARLTGSKSVFTHDEVVDFFKQCVDARDRYDFVLIAPNGHIIGESVINEIDEDLRKANFRIGIFHSEDCGKGIGSWVLQNTIAFAFEELRLHRLELNVFSFNPRAIKAYEKAGFKYEGVLRDGVKDGDEYAYDILMSILEDEWREPQMPAQNSAQLLIDEKPETSSKRLGSVRLILEAVGVILLLLVLGVSSGKVSREHYTSLQSEYSSLQTDYTTLQSKYNKTSSDMETANASLEATLAEYEAYKEKMKAFEDLSDEEINTLVSEAEKITDEKKAAEEKAAAEEEAKRKAAENASTEQKNALRRAKEYLEVIAFSHSGLIEQLEFEGFSTEAAAYAADNCDADWKEQAAQRAKDYMDVSAFSRSGLIDQLMFEGFSQAEAEYGVSAVGY